MAYLDVDLWPAGWIMATAALVIAGMRALERYAVRRAKLRTREALHALADPTDG